MAEAAFFFLSELHYSEHSTNVAHTELECISVHLRKKK